MTNKLVDRLEQVYPLADKNIGSHYYRNPRIRQLANYLHRRSYDIDSTNRAIELIKHFEQLGVKNFTYLCDLVANGRIHQLINDCQNIVRE